MAKASTPSFVHSLPLKVEPWQADILDARIDAARQIYNAVLGEALRRRDLMIQSRIYTSARKLWHASTGKTEAKKRFRDAERLYGFTEYDLHEYVKIIRNTQFKNLIDSLSAQKTATRAFSAVKEYHYAKKGQTQIQRIRTVPVGRRKKQRLRHPFPRREAHLERTRNRCGV